MSVDETSVRARARRRPGLHDFTLAELKNLVDKYESPRDTQAQWKTFPVALAADPHARQ